MPTIEWTDVLNIAPVTTTGMSEEEARKANQAQRPMLVYIYDDSDEDNDQRLGVEADKAFFDWKVTTGAKFFDCLRIDKESAAEDRVIKKYASRAPCLVLVRPNYKVATYVRAKFKAKKIVTAMTSAVKKDYKNCIPCVTRAQEDLWRKKSRLEKERSRLESQSKERALEKLQVKVDELDAKEAKLYELTPKT